MESARFTMRLFTVASSLFFTERNRRLVLAAFDPASLSKRSEQEIDIPQLK